MTANYEINPKMTFITATYLESTGWYQINSDYIRNTNWGLRRGCVFLSVINPFCTSDIEYGEIDIPRCSTDYMYKGVFETSSTTDVMEDCPILKPGNVFKVVTESDFCTSNHRTLTFNNVTDSYQESFGANSRCFMAQYSHKNVNSIDTSVKIPVCHNAKCEYDVNGQTTLKIFIDTQVIVCPADGGEISLGGSKFLI
jgi:hypothetical protein